MLWIFLACQSKSTKAELVESGLSGQPPSTQVEDLAWSSAELEQAIADLTVDSVPHAQPIIEGYSEWLGRGDVLCPGWPDDLSQDLTEGCTANTGYVYRGLSEVFSIEEEFEESPQGLDPTWLPEDGLTLIVDCDFYAPTGERFQGGGHVTEFLIAFSDSTDNRLAFGEIQGSWRDELSPLAWFENGVSGLYSYELWTDGVDVDLELDGAITTGGLGFAFSEVMLDSRCPQGFGGRMELRDPSGAWHVLESRDSCEPCAQHQLAEGSIEQTELCADWSFFLQVLSAKVEAQ